MSPSLKRLPLYSATASNVLSGETGAGKSILIDSINAILGNRTSREIVRSHTPKAMIWATFRGIGAKTRAQLADAGYEAENELLLYREITAEGKSTCRINGMPATASVVRDICSGLINIHGQHDNQSLMNPGAASGYSGFLCAERDGARCLLCGLQRALPRQKGN